MVYVWVRQHLITQTHSAQTRLKQHPQTRSTSTDVMTTNEEGYPAYSFPWRCYKEQCRYLQFTQPYFLNFNEWSMKHVTFPFISATCMSCLSYTVTTIHRFDCTIHKYRCTCGIIWLGKTKNLRIFRIISLTTEVWYCYGYTEHNNKDKARLQWRICMHPV